MNVGTGTFLESLCVFACPTVRQSAPDIKTWVYFAIGETITCSTRHSGKVCKGSVPNSNIPVRGMVNSHKHGGNKCNRISM